MQKIAGLFEIINGTGNKEVYNFHRKASILFYPGLLYRALGNLLPKLLSLSFIFLLLFWKYEKNFGTDIIDAVVRIVS